MIYKPVKIRTREVRGIPSALYAMRLPKPQRHDSPTLQDNFELAERLVRAGNDHAKFCRGIMVWYELKCQVGWLIEYEQYEIGVTRLSSSSAMHGELKMLSGEELAEKKQLDLPEKIYTIVDMASYQALRRVYMARNGHRHPDWWIFREWVESLPYFDYLIYPEGRGK